MKHSFFGTVDVDPLIAKKQVSELVDEVVSHFSTKHHVKLRLTLEVQAESKVGFDEALQRTVKENCIVMRFKTAEFE